MKAEASAESVKTRRKSLLRKGIDLQMPVAVEERLRDERLRPGVAMDAGKLLDFRAEGAYNPKRELFGRLRQISCAED